MKEKAPKKEVIKAKKEDDEEDLESDSEMDASDSDIDASGSETGVNGSFSRQAEKEDDDDDDDDEEEEDEDEKPKTSSVLKSALKKEPNGKKNGAAVNKKPQQNTPAQTKKNQKAATPAAKGKTVEQLKAATGKDTSKAKKKSESDDDDEDLSDKEDSDAEEDDDDEVMDIGEEDEDDEEEREVIKKKIASLKKDVLPKKDKKAQNKMSSKAPEPKNKKGKTLSENKSDDSNGVNNRTQDEISQKPLNTELYNDLQRKRERDACTLFIRGLPIDITVDEVKTLSADILDVRFPQSKFQKRKSQKSLFGFLEFATEQKAEENYIKLQKKKLRGREIFIDYTGEKSKYNNKSAGAPAVSEKNINKKKLFVSALPLDVTMAEVAQHFPHSFSITLNNAPEFRNCNVLFHTEEEAANAFEENGNRKIRDRAISVQYATEKGDAGRRQNMGFKRPFQGKPNFQPNKKMRF